MKEIGISGSSGFLGSTLGKRLEHFEPLNRFGDIPEGIDFVFDIAAFGNLASQRKDPIKIYEANLMRVIRSIENREPDTKFLFVSSSSVMRPVQNLYSLSKRASEEFLHLHENTAIMRPFSITGVGDQQEHLIPTLIRSCLDGTEMPFVAEPHHDYIDVGDVANALLTIRDKGQFKGEVYQVGRGKSYSNQEVLEMVEKATGRKANIRPVDSLREYDSDSWVSNNERIYSLGWEVTKPLEQSIKEMVYARKNN